MDPHEKVTREDLDIMELSQFADVVFQAAGRGAIRQSEGDGCKPCDIHLFARREVTAILPIIFPQCNVGDWDIIDEGLSKSELFIANFVRDRLKAVSDITYDTDIMVARGKDPKKSKSARKDHKNLIKDGKILDVLENDGIVYRIGRDRKGNYFEKVLDFKLF